MHVRETTGATALTHAAGRAAVPSKFWQVTLRDWRPRLHATEQSLQSELYCQVGHGLELHDDCDAGFDVVQ